MKAVNIDDPFLREALLSQINRHKIAVLLIDQKESLLIPTMLEDIFFHDQGILDKYCVDE